MRDACIRMKGIKQPHDCFQAELLSRLHCHNEMGKGDEAFQVQIKAKASFTSADPHIKHTEADLSSRLNHFKKHRRKHFIQEAFMFSELER